MRRPIYLLISVLLILLSTNRAQGQQATATGPLTDTQTLLDRIQQLEKRVQELEARTNQDHSTVPVSELANPSPALTSDQQGLSEVKEAVDFKRGLQIRGFGQVTFLADDLKGDRPAFTAGNFTLLLNSRLSEKLSAIGEIAIDEEGYGSSEFHTVLERALLQYQLNDYFKIDAGRYYSSIGYYNTEFYNSDWAQTTTRRPVVSAFQDDGGLMPMQRNGISISGRIPSGSAGLHYVAEIGGGDIVRSDVMGMGYSFPIQARTGFNLALFVRPRAVNGLQIGGSYFHDTEIPYVTGQGDPLVRQNLYSAYVVYNRPRWEFLNEAYMIHHGVAGYRDFNIPSFYTQLSHRLTPAWRPYFRFTYLNAGQNDPMLPDLSGRSLGIETGARYNFSEWVGLKFEYSRMQLSQPKTNINFGGTQLVFTF